ncbi:MAG: DNA mismatch endonuclease Vsr [Planctomycetes bacterium]|nr:DNA mismatch endonuclease Vsr [Planctomycetota bacterium]
MTSTDYVTDKRTSERMRRVRSRETNPEKVVRRLLTQMGYRYRLHRTDLPGQPDIVFSGRRKIVFVHGCFWHRHRGCSRCSMPKKNVPLWEEKFSRTVVRDRRNVRRLKKLDWDVLIVWECSVANEAKLKGRLKSFLED